jgi:hypothetical protein
MNWQFFTGARFLAARKAATLNSFGHMEILQRSAVRMTDLGSYSLRERIRHRAMREGAE